MTHNVGSPLPPRNLSPELQRGRCAPGRGPRLAPARCRFAPVGWRSGPSSPVWGLLGWEPSPSGRGAPWRELGLQGLCRSTGAR